jgi:filamin
VNTVNAGAGALAVTVEGPSKVKLECREVDEGYEFTYCPKAPGDYLITIRYAGVNIAGSPFKAKVEGEDFWRSLFAVTLKVLLFFF